MKEYLLGIDIGTSACKVAVLDRDGEAVSSANGKYPVYYPHPGWAEQSADEWYEGVIDALRKIWAEGKVKPGDIAGISTDGQSWSAVPVDRDGNTLARTPIWMDTRSKDICAEVRARIGADRLFELAGNDFVPTYTTPKVLWYKKHMPEVYEKIDKVLLSEAYINFRLTGEMTTDVCGAYGWHCFNMRTGKWDFDMAREIGIPESFLPPIAACDEIIGKVTKKAAEETGLMEGTPVVAGGLDAACGTLGAGVVHAGETQEQGGQAGGMSICLTEYKADPRLILSFHVVPGEWLIQGGTTGGGGVMRWFEHEFAGEERLREAETGKSSLTQLNEIAEKVAPGSDGLIFLPYMSGERTPIWDPNAKGLFYGIDFSKTKGHFVRAAMEGVAYALKHNLDVAEEAGAKADVLRSMGGSANSLLWTQIKSDVTGKPIVVPSSDSATARGAVMLAGVAIGMYKDYEEAVEITVHDKRSHTPNPDNAAVYQEEYEKYLRLYQELKDEMAR